MNKDLHVKINARHRRKQNEIKLKLKKEYYEKENTKPINIINRYTFDVMLEHSKAIAKLYERLSDYI